MVPSELSAVVEGLPLTTIQIDQHNKAIKRAKEDLIASEINQFEEEKGMKLFSYSVHSLTLYRQMQIIIFWKRFGLDILRD